MSGTVLYENCGAVQSVEGLDMHSTNLIEVHDLVQVLVQSTGSLLVVWNQGGPRTIVVVSVAHEVTINGVNLRLGSVEGIVPLFDALLKVGAV